MERQLLLVGLIIITLITNIILGIELYNALHNSSQTVGQVPINISNLQIVTSNSNSTSTSMQQPSLTSTQESSFTKENSSLYSFSFKVKFNIHVEERGIYLVGINPTNDFAQLYVILYSDDGQVVSLNLDHLSMNITVYNGDKDIEIIGYISGESYSNLTPQQVIKDIGLYIQFISPLPSNSTSGEATNTDFLLPPFALWSYERIRILFSTFKLNVNLS